METPDNFPARQDIAADLKKIVGELDHWQRLSLPSLRALPSIRFWQAPKNVQARHASNPNRLTCLAIARRVNEAIGSMGSSKEQRALTSILDFTESPPGVKKRREAAAKNCGVKPESFRTGSEKKLLLILADEMLRGELAWAVNHLDPALKG